MLQDFLGNQYYGHELAPPVKTRLHEIATRITVLIGERDFRGTRLWEQRIADRSPDATLIALPVADHFPMLSAPHPVERILRDVLR